MGVYAVLLDAVGDRAMMQFHSRERNVFGDKLYWYDPDTNKWHAERADAFYGRMNLKTVDLPPVAAPTKIKTFRLADLLK